MRAGSAIRLLRLYPSDWRARYGTEFAALLEDHSFSLKTFFNLLRSAMEAHMQAFKSNQREPVELCGWIWWAWMLAISGGMILYGMVDDSSFVTAMSRDSFFGGCWRGLEAGSLVAGSAIMVAGLPLAWSVLRYALHTRRSDILVRLAFPFSVMVVLTIWLAVVISWTGGTWGASPWAVPFSRPDWPPELFRWITGSITAALLIFGFAGSAMSITQAMRRSEFPDLRLTLPSIRLEFQPLRFAAALAPLAAMGILRRGYASVVNERLADYAHSGRGGEENRTLRRRQSTQHRYLSGSGVPCHISRCRTDGTEACDQGASRRKGTIHIRYRRSVHRHRRYATEIVRYRSLNRHSGSRESLIAQRS
jgi:hypothetical protein